MTQSLIQAEALVKTFGTQTALSVEHFAVEPGQVVGLVGTNGSGKSTLLKCLLGLLRPTSGTCSIFGEDSWTLSPSAKAKIGYVSQDFSLLSWMKTQAICEYTEAFYEHWDATLVKKLLQEWELEPKKRVHQLSIGQRQKLAVILALGHHPQLLVLDEPVASLDPVARRRFLQSLIEFSGQELHTVLFSTHITSDLERVASHVAMLQKGGLRYYGELDRLKESCKRLRIHAEKPLPSRLEIPGLLRCEINSRYALAAVSELTPETLAQLRANWQAQVTVEDLNLEEIFLELNGQSTAAMPLSTTEVAQ